MMSHQPKKRLDCWCLVGREYEPGQQRYPPPPGPPPVCLVGREKDLGQQRDPLHPPPLPSPNTDEFCETTGRQTCCSSAGLRTTQTGMPEVEAWDICSGMKGLAL